MEGGDKKISFLISVCSVPLWLSPSLFLERHTDCGVR